MSSVLFGSLLTPTIFIFVFALFTIAILEVIGVAMPLNHPLPTTPFNWWRPAISLPPYVLVFIASQQLELRSCHVFLVRHFMAPNETISSKSTICKLFHLIHMESVSLWSATITLPIVSILRFRICWQRMLLMLLSIQVPHLVSLKFSCLMGLVILIMRLFLSCPKACRLIITSGLRMSLWKAVAFST